MLGVKKFFFYVFALVVLGFVLLAIYLHRDPSADAWWCPSVFFGLPFLFGMFYIRHTTKCPKCKKAWVGKRISKEDLGPCSNAFRKKSGDTYHTYEKHKYLLSYKCTACGHEYQKTMTQDERLD